jgi:DNA polymerase III alpha subunit
MAFLSIEDESGELENIVVFPDIYEQNKDIMYEQATVLLSGKIPDKKRNSFIVDKVFLI